MTPTPGETLTRIRREIERTAFRARNGIKHLAGVATAQVGSTPRIAVWSRDKVRLYRYQPDDGVPRGEPLLLVMSLVTRPTVFDLLPDNSLVASLLAAGRDVYLLEWGTPDAVESANTLETYCDEYLPRAVGPSQTSPAPVRSTCSATARWPAHPDLRGRPSRASRAGPRAAGRPRRLREMGPLTALVRTPWFDITSILDETGNVPGSTIMQGMRQLDPTGDVKTYLNLWNSLEDDKQLAAHEAMVGWSGDHIPVPGRGVRADRRAVRPR